MFLRRSTVPALALIPRVVARVDVLEPEGTGASWRRGVVRMALYEPARGHRDAPPPARLGDIYLSDRVGESLGSFLRQVVPDAARNGPVRVAAGEFAGVGAGVGVRRAIGIALERDRRHRNHGPVASWFSRSSYFGSPSASPRRHR